MAESAPASSSTVVRAGRAHAPLPSNQGLLRQGSQQPSLPQTSARNLAEAESEARSAADSIVGSGFQQNVASAPAPSKSHQPITSGSGGSPLDAPTRRHFESAFGQSLSSVRVHSGPEAAASAASLAARAYTVGDDVVFGSGRYSPGTTAGRHLLAHELTHVVQQRSAAYGLQCAPLTPEEIRVQLEALERRAATPASMSPEDTAALSEERALLMQQLETAMRLRALSGVSSSARPPVAPTTPPAAVSEAPRSSATAPITSQSAASSRSSQTAVPPDEMVDLVLDQRNFSAGEPITAGGPAPYAPADFPSADLPGRQGAAAGPGYETNAAVQVVDSEGRQMAFEFSRYGGGGGPHAEAQALARLRLRLTGSNVRGGRMIVAVDQVACSDCMARLRALARELGLESFEVWVPQRSEGSATSPKWTARSASIRPARTPATSVSSPRGYRAQATRVQGETLNVEPPAAPAAPASPVAPAESAQALPVEAPAAPLEAVPVAPEAAAAPTRPAPSGAWRGTGGTVLSLGLQIAAGFIHASAVRDRIRRQAAQQGGVAPDAPSGEGLLYDLGAWLIDPFRSAEAAVGPDDRMNVPVLRARIRRETAALQPGQTYTMTWYVGRCRRDSSDHQVFDKVVLVYRKQPDGTFALIQGDGSDAIDLNRLISTGVSDELIRAAGHEDPCSA